MDNSELAERMKFYEKKTSSILLPLIPVLARVDGRCFHSFCRGLKRPYDKRLSDLMVETTKFLVEETNANCGYTQSDEISFVWYVPSFKSQIFFNGKLLKMTSVLASIATAIFNKNLPEMIPEKKDKLAFFDARVWNVPTIQEVANYFYWRELDSVRNSIVLAGREPLHFCSTKMFGRRRNVA